MKVEEAIDATSPTDAMFLYIAPYSGAPFTFLQMRFDSIARHSDGVASPLSANAESDTSNEDLEFSRELTSSQH